MKDMSVAASDRRVVKTKAAIRGALLRLLGDKDLTQVRVTELADLANINRKTFYTHYQKVDDILNEIEDDFVTRLKKAITDNDQESDRQRIHRVFEALNRIIEGDFELYQNLIRLDASTSLMNKIKDALKQMMLSVAARRPTLPEEIAFASTEYVISGILSMYVEWLYSSRNLPLQKLADIASALSYSSLVTMYAIEP